MRRALVLFVGVSCLAALAGVHSSLPARDPALAGFPARPSAVPARSSPQVPEHPRPVGGGLLPADSRPEEIEAAVSRPAIYGDGSTAIDRRILEILHWFRVERLDEARIEWLEEVAIGSGDESLAEAARLVLESHADRLWDDRPEEAAVLAERLDRLAELLDSPGMAGSQCTPPEGPEPHGWKDPEESLRLFAVVSLERPLGDRARRILLQMAEADPSSFVRECALRVAARSADREVRPILDRIAAGEHDPVAAVARRLSQNVSPSSREELE